MQLVEAVSCVWMDLYSMCLYLRAGARKAFVIAMRATAEQVGACTGAQCLLRMPTARAHP